MRQKITNFYRDDENHWTALLAWGHSQPTRHDPPWQIRPWVETDEGRTANIGRILECSKCDETEQIHN
jgi:hypothetical protein